MLNLLRADFYRLKKSRALLYIVLVGAAAIAGLVYVFKYAADNGLMDSADGIAKSYIVGVSLAGLSELPTGIDMAYRVAGSGDFIPIMIGIFVCIYVTNEYSYGTIKNILSVGNKKKDFYLSKLVTVSVSAVIIVLSLVLSALLAGCLIFGFEAEAGDIAPFVQMLAMQLLLHIAYAAIFLMVAALIKNNGASVAICVGIVILNRMLFTAADWLFGSGTSIQSFCLSVNITELTAHAPAINILTKALLVGFIYIIIPTAAGSLISSRQDIN